MKHLCLIILLLTFGNARSQSIFADLRVTQYGDSILINWTLKGGFTCVDMELQRSADNVVYDGIYQVAGVCGGADDQYYSYVDSEALTNGTIYYYRVTATSDFYMSESTSILYINAGENDLFVYPNPSDDQFNITIDNSHVPPFLMEIWSADSKQLNSSEMIYTNNFIVQKGILPDGMYIVKITTKDRVVFSRAILMCD